MNTLDHLFRLFDVFGEARGISEARTSTLVFGAGHKIASLRAGRDIGVRRLAEAVEWFSDHWPDGAVWPAEVARLAAATGGTFEPGEVPPPSSSGSPAFDRLTDRAAS